MPRAKPGRQRVKGPVPRLSPQAVAEAAADLAIRRTTLSGRQWARRLNVSETTLRRAIKGFKHHQVRP